MTNREYRQFILGASCPKCGWRPSMRAYAALVEVTATLPPDTPCSSMKCQRKGCETTYVITARAYQNARAA